MGSNQQPSNQKSSTLPLDKHAFRSPVWSPSNPHPRSQAPTRVLKALPPSQDNLHKYTPLKSLILQPLYIPWNIVGLSPADISDSSPSYPGIYRPDHWPLLALLDRRHESSKVTTPENIYTGKHSNSLNSHYLYSNYSNTAWIHTTYTVTMVTQLESTPLIQ